MRWHAPFRSASETRRDVIPYARSAIGNPGANLRIFLDSRSVLRTVGNDKLKHFLIRPEIDFLRPGRALLLVDVPVGLGDCIDAEQSVLAALLQQARSTPKQTLAMYAAIDHGMRDMEPERPVFARHALRDHAQARFGGG